MKFTRLAGWSGIGSVVLGTIAFFMYGSQPALDASAAEIAEYLADTGDSYLRGLAVSTIALFVTGIFLAGLIGRFVEADRGTGEGWGLLAAIGGVSFYALALAGTALFGVLSLRGGSELEATTVRAFSDFGILLYVPALVAFGLMAFAVAMGIRKHGLMPKWFGWLSWVVAALGLIAVLAMTDPDLMAVVFPAYFGSVIWSLAGGIALVRQK